MEVVFGNVSSIVVLSIGSSRSFCAVSVKHSFDTSELQGGPTRKCAHNQK
jgi:hypothetical protein